jgi:hypothetical protein
MRGGCQATRTAEERERAREPDLVRLTALDAIAAFCFEAVFVERKPPRHKSPARGKLRLPRMRVRRLARQSPSFVLLLPGLFCVCLFIVAGPWSPAVSTLPAAATETSTAAPHRLPTSAPTGAVTPETKAHFPRKPRIILGNETGEFCNRLLAIAVGLSLAKSTNSTLVLWGGWKTTVNDALDVERLVAFAGDSVALEDAQPADAIVLHEDAQEQTWCGSKASLTAVRTWMRPHLAARLQAEQALQRLKQSGKVRTTMAVHGRNQRNLCRMRTNKFPDFCHESSAYDNENRTYDICDYRMSPALARAVSSEWPDANFSDVGVYLMTDSERPDYDATFLRPALPAPFVLALQQNVSMIADMWAAANADYYLANPISSCEGVVAQWRAELHGDHRVRQYPRRCFEPYAQPEVASDVCRHTRVFTLGHPGDLNECEMVLALAVALSKLEGASGGRLVLWGPWRALVEARIDLAHLKRARPMVQFVLATKMPHSRPQTKERYWFGIQLNPRAEASCAAGKVLNALKHAIRPRLGANASALNAPSRPSLVGRSFCFAGSQPLQSRAQPLRVPILSQGLEQAWRNARSAEYVGGARNACDQIAAHWAAEELKPRDCFGPYLLQAEDSSRIRAVKSQDTWECS